METSWYPIVMACSVCNQPTALAAVLYSADGELRFIGHCFECKTEIRTEVFITKLAHMALMNDLEKAAAKSSANARQKLLPSTKPVPDQHEKDDADFLHDLGIIDPPK